MKKIIIFIGILSLPFMLLAFKMIFAGAPELISPLVSGQKILGINQWFPTLITENEDSAPEISAKAALFIETKDGKVLYAKNTNQKLPIASLVKVMTVLIALEHKSMDDTYVVSKQASEMEPDEMILLPGEKLTLKEVLYGIFLVSANDAAEVLAEETTGDRKEFVKLMNIRAKQLGMNNTYFANPTGLDEEADNSYSTAFDLVILTRYLIRNYPEVVNISKAEHMYLPKTETHQDYDMYSGINLLTTYPGVVGFKTGYTPEAGLTLITLARKNGQEVIGVLLGSSNRRDEARELLDYSFQKLGI